MAQKGEITRSGGQARAMARSLAVGFLLQIMVLLSWDVCGTYGQNGFISIDCGASSSYEDDSGISWSTDSDYIRAGKNVPVDTSGALLGTERTQTGRQMSTARVFTESRWTKFCYVFPEVDALSVYMIRYRFLAGNLMSASSQNISFEITANQFLWGSLTFSAADSFTPQTVELNFITPASKTLSLCLVPRTGTPFISSLELRPLPSMYYQTANYPQSVFNLLYRWNCGANQSAAPIRYPADIYDRLYYPPPAAYNFTSIANSEFDGATSSILNPPPLDIFQSAWVAPRARTIDIALPGTTSFLFVFLYFAELQSLGRNATREVVGFLDNVSMGDAVTVSTIAASLLFNYTTSRDIVNLSVRASKTSTEGPILSALEAFEVIYYNSSYDTSVVDAEAISVLQASLNLTDWTGDPCLPYAWDWLQCSSPNETTISRVIEINLSNFNLSGSIPTNISRFTALEVLSLDNNNLTGDISLLTFPQSLQTLRLQNNQLSGHIPASLASLPDLVNLNLDNNRLTGKVPDGLLLKKQSSFLNFSAAGNPGLCDVTNSSCSDFTSPSPSPLGFGPGGRGSSKKGSSIGIIAGAIGGVVAVVALLLVLLFRYKNKIFQSSHKEVSIATKDQPRCRRFSYDEVKVATNDFQKKIGQGGYGEVFHGKLSDSEEVAVKRNSARDGQGTNEFLNEVELLSRVHHRNLVSLVGYCDEAGHEILIYPFMSEGTLRQHLDAHEKKPLDWSTRLNIALNSARGLEYLHNSCYPPIIHRDVKSSNILLTKDLLAKVADFGISKITTETDKTRGITTNVKGTYGYLDPEYMAGGRLTIKTDVYCFGVMLLELITGKKPNDAIRSSETEAFLYLQNWVKDAVRAGDLRIIMDPHLQQQEGFCNPESVWKVVELALQSLHRDGTRRPAMQEILEGLTQAKDLQKDHARTPPVMEGSHSPSLLASSSFNSYQRMDSSRRRN